MLAKTLADEASNSTIEYSEINAVEEIGNGVAQCGLSIPAIAINVELFSPAQPYASKLQDAILARLAPL